MPYKFELYEDKNGKTRFNFVAPNGQVMFSSQGYEQRTSAKKTIDSIKKNAPGADVVDRD
jgi:uncharacterized protein YegP (UPF0339 family)